MSRKQVKLLFTKSMTLRGSMKKIESAQKIIRQAKIENSDYFEKVMEALKRVPYKKVQSKSMSY